MNPKEKAKDLVDKFQWKRVGNSQIEKVKLTIAIQCAIIAVEEILKLKTLLDDDFAELIKDKFPEHTEQYWNEVLQELKAM